VVKETPSVILDILEKGQGKERRRKEEEGRQRRKGKGKEGEDPVGRRGLLSRRLASWKNQGESRRIKGEKTRSRKSIDSSLE